jgi:hypothetical protein
MFSAVHLFVWFNGFTCFDPSTLVGFNFVLWLNNPASQYAHIYPSWSSAYTRALVAHDEVHDLHHHHLDKKIHEGISDLQEASCKQAELFITSSSCDRLRIIMWTSLYTRYNTNISSCSFSPASLWCRFFIYILEIVVDEASVSWSRWRKSYIPWHETRLEV